MDWMTNWVFPALLGAHIVAGMVSLVAGLLALLLRKGKGPHAKAGTVFFWAMLTVCGSATSIYFIRGNVFLLLIGLFSFYMVFTGWRSVQIRRLQSPSLLPDQIAAVLAANVGGWMIGQALLGNGKLWQMSLVFGSILMSMAWSDVQQYFFRDIGLLRDALLVKHISRMMGGLIAAITAFLVVNVQIGSATWLLWLLPTALLTPLIVYHSRRTRTRLTDG